jgi:hypothetical protein
MFKKKFNAFQSCAIVLAILVAGFFTFNAGCTREKYIDKNDPLWDLVGAEYELITDCYVVEYHDPNVDLKGPMITCNINKPGIGSPELPLEVKKENIGRVYDSIKIIGIIPKGTQLKIIAIKRLISSEVRIWIFEVALTAPVKDQAVGQKYDVLWLLNRKDINLGFDESVARRIN